MAVAGQPLTLYGIVDLSLYYNPTSQAARDGLSAAISETNYGMTSGVLSGSRWGIKASESLSPEWSVNFVLEGGINAQNGTLGQGGLGFGRQSTVGVASSRLGSLDLGRQGSLAYKYLVPFDPFAISGSQAGMGVSFGSANGVRPNNLILYQTAVIHGWQAGVGFSLNTGFTAAYYDGAQGDAITQPATSFFGTTQNMRMLTLGLRYSRGPLSMVFAYDMVYAANQLITDDDQVVSNKKQPKPRAWLLGGQYDFRWAQISAVIGQTVGGNFFGQGPGAGGYSSSLSTASRGTNMLFADGARSFQYSLAATIAAGRDGRVLLSWQASRPYGSFRQAEQLATQNVFSAAYVYSLSKRTDLYVWGSYGNNYQTISTAKSSVIGTGIRHLF